MTRLILPPTVLTVIPRFGAVSLLPLPGVIDNPTPLAAAPDPLPTLAWLAPWLAAAVEPPEQAATSNPSVAQTATAASPWPRSPEDRKEMTCEMAAGRHFKAPDCTDTAYAAPTHPTPVWVGMTSMTSKTGRLGTLVSGLLALIAGAALGSGIANSSYNEQQNRAPALRIALAATAFLVALAALRVAVKRLRRPDKPPSNIAAVLLVALTLVLIFLDIIVAVASGPL